MLTDRSRKAITTCSALAIAVALAAGSSAARAQTAPNPSFLGTATFNPESVSVQQGTGATPSTTVTISTPQAVIDWQPFDTSSNPGVAIQFQQAGTATFQSFNGDFAVLNRIIPSDQSRPVQFNGDVVSQILPIEGPGSFAGGTVFFYSPGGVIVGSSARFNVGSLGLTSADPLDPLTGNWIDANRTVQFRTANPGTAVEIRQGAQISTTLANSYVAAVAPRVANAGAITVDGSAALVSADAATITFNPDGLFNIQVSEGTSATGTVLSNSGSITGVAGSPGAAHRIYMVAVPKNDAITMAIAGGSTLGFGIANSAAVDGDAVILSGGYEVFGGQRQTFPAFGGGTGLVDVNITNSAITSNLDAGATGSAQAAANDGTTSFLGDVLLEGARPGPGAVGAQLRASGPTGRLTVGGNTILRATSAPFSSEGESRIGSLVQVAAVSGGEVELSQNLTIESNAAGEGSESLGTNPGAGIGGVAQIFINDGTVAVRGNVDLTANGFGGDAFSSGLPGGLGRGGAARVVIVGAASSTLDIDGSLTASAYGQGGAGQNCATCTVEGGLGQGGEARIGLSDGAHTVTIGGSVSLDASGQGGEATLNQAGAGIGGGLNPQNGGAALSIISGASLIDIDGNVFLGASGFGGNHFLGGVAGGGMGGGARINTGPNGGRIDIGGLADVVAGASGGFSFFFGEGQPVGLLTGGGAAGGIAEVFAPSGLLTFGGNLQLSSSASGGFSSSIGGDAQGGQSLLLADGGSIAVTGNLEVRADGSGGGGFAAGEGRGGTARILAQPGTITALAPTTMRLSEVSFSEVSVLTQLDDGLLYGVEVSADGTGGFGSDGGAGGNGFGGNASILADNSTDGPVSRIELSEARVTAVGQGGEGSLDFTTPGSTGGDGGVGEGGTVSVGAASGIGNLTAAGVIARATGLGGAGHDGGEGAFDFEIGVYTSGGGAGGAGGSGIGGSVTVGIASGTGIAANTGSASLGVVSADANGHGGGGGAGGIGTTQGAGGAGGDGIGGSGTLSVRGAPLTITTALIEANGVGGSGGLGSPEGAGGNGTSGRAGVFVGNGDLVSQRGALTATDITVNALGAGGSGSIAGVGTLAGSVFFDVQNGDATFDNATLLADADVVAPTAPASLLNVLNGTVNAGSFSLTTDHLATVQLDNATFNAGFLQLHASNFVLPATAPAIAGTFSVSSGLDLATTQDFLTYANFNLSFGDSGVAAPGAFQIGNFTSTGALTLSAVGAVTIGDIDATNVNLASDAAMTLGSIASGADISLLAAQALSTGAASAAGNVVMDAGTTLSVAGAIDAGGFVELVGPQGITTGAIDAGTYAELDAGGPIATGAITTGEYLDIFALGSLAVAGDVQAGQSVTLNAGTTLTAGNIVAGVEPGGQFSMGLVATGDITLGKLTGPGTIGILSQMGSISALDIDAGAFLALAANSVSLGSLATSPTGIAYIANASMGSLGGALDETFDPAPIFSSSPVPTGGPIIIAGPVTVGSLAAATQQSITVGGALVAAGSVELINGTGLMLSDVTAGENIAFSSAGAIVTGDLDSGGFIALNSQVSIGTGDLTAASSIGLATFGSMTTGDIAAGTSLTLDAGAGLTAGTLSAGSDIDVVAGGPVSVGDLSAGLDVDLASGGTLTGGSIRAGNAIGIQAEGPISLGNLTAALGTDQLAEQSVGVASRNGAVSVGDVSTRGDIGILAGTGSIAAGNLAAGSDVLLLASDSVRVGGISANPGSGRIYIADASLAQFGGPLEDFDPEPIFARAPAALDGSVTLAGPVTGSIFTAAALGTFTAGAMTLGQSITIDPALVQVNGPWVAPTISIDAQQIQFGSDPAAGLGARGITQNITLRALASGQTAVFGGTTQGSGYTLTQGDFGRIRTDRLTLLVDPQGVASTAPDLEIRDLTLTGSAGGGLSSVTISTPGAARVVGDLVLAQAGAQDQMIVGASRRLEIVLPQGSIAITGAGGALAGTLTLSSSNLVAGTLDLLQQIMADPQAAGLAEALARPASTTANLEGYIRANGVNLLTNANILLQNSGTARDFAGVTVGGGGLIVGRLTPISSGGTSGGTGGGTTTTTGFSFVGMLIGPDDELFFDFTVDASSNVTLRTYSYAGGVNAAGQSVPAGGFDPILALFDAAGQLIAQNDDGGINVPADPATGNRYDTFLTSQLQPGSYKVAVTAFSNFANGPTLADGFEGGGSFGGRTQNFAFDVLGAQTATGPGSQTPTPSGPLNVIGFGRRIAADGQAITGDNFFATIDFGNGAGGLVYSDISQFNTCLVNSGCVVAPTPVVPSDPVAGLSSEITLIGEDTLEEEPFDEPDEEDEEEDEDGQVEAGGLTPAEIAATQGGRADDRLSAIAAAEALRGDEAAGDDDASSPIVAPETIVSTRTFDTAVEVNEPVSGSGNPALIGSELNNPAQETQP